MPDALFRNAWFDVVTILVNVLLTEHAQRCAGAAAHSVSVYNVGGAEQEGWQL